MITEAINTILQADVAVSAIVGTAIYPDATPQDTDLPYVVWDQSTDQPGHCTRGETGTVVGQMTFGCAQTSRKLARTLADKVRLALRDITGTYNSTVIYGFWKQDSQDVYIAPEDGSDVGVYRTDVVFKVAYAE